MLFFLKKVFYYLEQYETSMKFALKAGKLFDVSQKNEYTQTLVGERHFSKKKEKI